MVNQSDKCRGADIVENTTFHGWKDLYDAKSYFGRVFWILTIIVALVAMVFQVYSIALDYANEVTASKLHPNMNDRLPNVTVCPYVWSDLTKYVEREGDLVGNLTTQELGELDEYMNGYFSNGALYAAVASGQVEDYRRRLGKYADLAKRILERYNGSLEKFVLGHAPKAADVISRYQFPPFNVTARYTTWVSQAGVYYTIEQADNTKIDEIYKSNSVLSFRVNLAKDDRFPLYFLVLGGMNEHAAFGKVFTPLNRGVYSMLIGKSHKTVLVNKRSRPCSKENTPSDYMGCLARQANQNCHNCKHFLPKTPKYEEQSFGAESCHALGENCVMTHDELILERCLPPCEKTNYELTVVGETDFYSKNSSYVYLSLADTDLNIFYEEYFIYSVSSLFSSLGGVVSLWCGASIVSIVQLVYLLWMHERKAHVRKRRESTLDFK